MAVRATFFDLGNTLVGSSGTWQPGAKQLLAHLSQQGLRLGIISNTGDLANRQAILELLPSDFDLALFEMDLVLFSSELGLEKPDPAVFTHAVSRAGIAAAECFYCSEDAVETLAAQAVGMHSLRIISGSSDLANLPVWLGRLG